jgi:ABC-type transport system involved in cytochrome bd biosynthesis fused ATPase/permease subunit
MTNTLLQEKRRLSAIIDQNIEAANNGSASAQMQVVAAQADLDRIAQQELQETLAISGLPLEMELLSF